MSGDSIGEERTKTKPVARRAIPGIRVADSEPDTDLPAVKNTAIEPIATATGTKLHSVPTETESGPVVAGPKVRKVRGIAIYDDPPAAVAASTPHVDSLHALYDEYVSTSGSHDLRATADILAMERSVGSFFVSVQSSTNLQYQAAMVPVLEAMVNNLISLRKHRIASISLNNDMLQSIGTMLIAGEALSTLYPSET